MEHREFVQCLVQILLHTDNTHTNQLVRSVLVDIVDMYCPRLRIVHPHIEHTRFLLCWIRTHKDMLHRRLLQLWWKSFRLDRFGIRQSHLRKFLLDMECIHSVLSWFQHQGHIQHIHTHLHRMSMSLVDNLGTLHHWRIDQADRKRIQFDP